MGGPEPGGSQGGREGAGIPGCYVHICGEVKAPGVYQLEGGSRVFQAIQMAGGFTEEAAADYLNQAAVVWDGMKIVVPRLEDMEGLLAYGGMGDGQPGAGGPGGSQPRDPGPAKVDLNGATKEQLMTLKGIGASRAEDIIRYREERGGFSKIEDIMKVPGIKDAAFQKIKDDITVEVRK